MEWRRDVNMESEERQLRHLADAGCGGKVAEKVLEMRRIGNRTGEKELFAKLRRTLLNRIHANQKKLDCLDFLLYQMNLNGKEL